MEVLSEHLAVVITLGTVCKAIVCPLALHPFLKLLLRVVDILVVYVRKPSIIIRRVVFVAQTVKLNYLTLCLILFECHTGVKFLLAPYSSAVVQLILCIKTFGYLK